MTVELYDTLARKTLPLEEVFYRFVWQDIMGRDTTVSFEGYLPAAKDYPIESLQLSGFHVRQVKGYVVGVASSLGFPSGLYLDAEHLLKEVWKENFDIKDGWLYPHAQPPNHPEITVIPESYPGAGSLIVRDQRKLRYGYGKVTGERLSIPEQNALNKERTEGLLLEMGYVRKGSRTLS